MYEFWGISYNGGLWLNKKSHQPRMFKTRKSAIANARKYLCDGTITFQVVKFIGEEE